jgi:hypothetical protein
MTFMHTLRLVVAGTLLAPALTLSAQNRPPIRPLGQVTATTSETLTAVSNIRAIPGGRLLVNDAASRRVLLLDSTMKVLAVVADSTPSTANAYGPRSALLLPFRGDSTLFIDAASLSMLVIDPNGKLTDRVMSVPRSGDASMLALGAIGSGAFYSNGALVYRGMPNFQMQMRSGGSGAPAGLPAMPQLPDSMPIVRVNLQTRAVDTLGQVKIPRTRPNVQRSDDGRITVSIEINPLPVVDEWTVTSTGDVAFIRGSDYHIDWVSSTGERRSSPKIAFDWKRLSDDDKVKLIDSVRVLREKMAAANPGQGQQMAAAVGAAMGAPGGATGGAPMMIRMEVRGDGGGAPPTRMPQIQAPQMTYVSPSELPDYQPPFFATSARADEDGNIWIRTIPTKPQPAGSVYDVINSKGEAIDRVLVPDGRTLVGFAPGGVVILSWRDGDVTRLERVKLR